MAKVKVCDMCGGSGYSTSMLTCCYCKRNSEHIYCRLAMSADVPEFWYCDECLGGADINKNMQSSDAGAFVPCDMKPSTQCARDGSTKGRNNEFKSCTMKRSMNGLHDLAICRPPFKQPRSEDRGCNTDGLLHTNVSNIKVEKESILRKELLATYAKEFDSIPEHNLGLGELLKKSQGKCASDHPSEAYFDFQMPEHKFQGMPCQNIFCGSQDMNANSYSGTSCWRVILDASDEKFSVCCEVDVYYPSNLSNKAWEYSRKMPTILKLKIMPRFSLWPKIFTADPPTVGDIGLLFFPSEVESFADSYAQLVDYVESQDVALKCSVEDAELLIYPSKWLRFGPDMRYLWGAFRCLRRKKSCEKRTQKNPNPAKSRTR